MKLFIAINETYLKFFGISYKAVLALFMLFMMMFLCGAMTLNGIGIF